MKNTYRDSVFVNQHEIKSKHVKVGDYTYYSGYYHGGDFNDCVLHLDEIDDSIEETDELIIGKFCCIASGVKFVMGGNQGHDYSNVTAYPLEILKPNFHGYGKESPQAYHRKGNTTIVLQRALRSCDKLVAEDGLIGSETFSAVSNSDPKILLATIKSEAAGYYRLIAAKNSSQKKCLNGWLNRAYRKIVL